MFANTPRSASIFFCKRSLIYGNLYYSVLTGSDVPTLQHLNAYVRPLLADVWYDLGLQLLDPDDVSKLDTIKDNNATNSSRACTEMFSLWLQKNPSASWDSLISKIKGPGVEKHDVAHKIKQMLQPLAGS